MDKPKGIKQNLKITTLNYWSKKIIKNTINLLVYATQLNRDPITIIWFSGQRELVPIEVKGLKCEVELYSIGTKKI